MAAFYDVIDTPQQVRDFLALEKMSIKDFAAVLKVTPQYLGGVLNGRLPFSDNLKSKIEAEINARQGERFSNLVELHADCVAVRVRFTTYEWHTIQAFLPADFDLEKAIRNFINDKAGLSGDIGTFADGVKQDAQFWETLNAPGK